MYRFRGTYLALPWIEQLGAEKTAIQTVGNMSFINKKWLDFLGLEMPTTVDEFEQVLIAFRDNADAIKSEFGIEGDIIPMSCIVNNGDQDPSILINGFGEGYGDADKDRHIAVTDDLRLSARPLSRATVKVLTGCTSCILKTSLTPNALRRNGPPMFLKARPVVTASALAGMLPTSTT